MRQLPTMLGPAVHRWRIQPIILCRPCVIRARDPNNVGRAVQTDPLLFRYALAIMEQKKCWEFDRFHTLCNNTQQHATRCANGRNMPHPRMLGVVGNNVASVLHGALVNYKENVSRNSCCIKVAIKRVVYSWQHPGLC